MITAAMEAMKNEAGKMSCDYFNLHDGQSNSSRGNTLHYQNVHESVFRYNDQVLHVLCLLLSNIY
jgi:hypothetical protein